MTKERIEYKGFYIRIEPDEDPLNPRRDWEPLGTMICFHRRYNLGDKDVPYRESDFDSWNELKDKLWKEQKAIIVLPVRMYDHGNIGLSTGASHYPFNCPWDSGWVGFIYITRGQAVKHMGWKIVSKKRKALLEQYLRQEVETYSQYLSGDVWNYIIEEYVGSEEDREYADDGDFEEVSDSYSSGHYGYSECLKDAQDRIDYEIQAREKQRRQEDHYNRQVELAGLRMQEAVGI